ncbi:hypothetical protein LSH36_738g01022 [Paralvinella palmiformis]|uniref:Uncharacterized protein n=1 Tax=Paralvinella palmiformis TaxID=53620 RepID=A0AAD9MTB6_9ANNE|nr:hypothetical protein LSH36_738g01022 [Paralvinella palmiformis]
MNCATCGSRRFRSPHLKPKDKKKQATGGRISSASQESLDNVPYGVGADGDLDLKTGPERDGTPPVAQKRAANTWSGPVRDGQKGTFRDRNVEASSQSSGSSRVVLDAFSNRQPLPSPTSAKPEDRLVGDAVPKTTPGEETINYETATSDGGDHRTAPVLSDYYLALRTSPDLLCPMDDDFEMEWDDTMDGGKPVSKESERLSWQPSIDSSTRDGKMADTYPSDARPAEMEKFDNKDPPAPGHGMDGHVTEDKQETYADFKKNQRSKTSSMSDWYKNRIGHKEQNKKWLRIATHLMVLGDDHIPSLI